MAATPLQQKKRHRYLIMLLVVVIIILGVIFGRRFIPADYFVFVSVPAPPPIRTVQINFEILQHEIFDELGSAPEPLEYPLIVGRTNPFIPPEDFGEHEEETLFP